MKTKIVLIVAAALAVLAANPATARDRNHGGGHNRDHGGVSISLDGYGGYGGYRQPVYRGYDYDYPADYHDYQDRRYERPRHNRDRYDDRSHRRERDTHYRDNRRGH